MNLIITDFDGTLFDTFEAHYASYKDALNYYGFDLDKDKYKELFGLPTDEILRKSNIPADMFQNIKNRKVSIYKNYMDLVTINNTLYGTLYHCYDDNKKVVIASNGSIQNMNIVLNHFTNKGYDMDIFDGIYSINDYDFPNKKSLFTKILIDFDCQAWDALLYEDSLKSIQYAIELGMFYIDVTGKSYYYK